VIVSSWVLVCLGFDEEVKLFEMENIAEFDEDLERGRQIAEDLGY
jgi:hypothetical protein